MGDLLDPTCPIAKAFREEAVREAEERVRVQALIEAREASRAKWASMTRDEKQEAMYDGDESEWEG
jgi:hypothetical protein